MNGVHDMGGMQGMGPIKVEENEPVFHDEWEARVFGMNMLAMVGGNFNIDQSRHAMERMGAAAYLETTYYEHWMTAMQTLLLENGTLTRAEIDARMEALKDSGG